MKRAIFIFSLLLCFATLQGQLIGVINSQSVVTAGGVPSFLTSDGHTSAWYISSETGDITKSGGSPDYVSRWNDHLGSGHDLINANSDTYRPTWTATGISFSSNDNLRSGTFTFAQPITIYLVIENVTYVNTGAMLDGYNNLSMVLTNTSTEPNIQIYAGNFAATNTNFTTGAFSVVTLVFNGANSSVRVNATAVTTGNAGTGNPAGITFGGWADESHAGTFIVKEAIFRNISDSDEDKTLVYNYLKTLYGL